MRLTEFSMTLGETINVGNYNNVKYEVSATIIFVEGADPEKDIADLHKYLRAKAATVRATVKGA